MNFEVTDHLSCWLLALIVPHRFFPGFKEFRKTCGAATDKNKDHPVAAQSTAGTVRQTIHLECN